MSRIVVPTFHPGMLASAGDKSLMKFTSVVVDDLRRALALTIQQPDWDERAVWETDSVGRLKNLFPTVEEVGEFTGMLLRYNIEGRPTVLTFDVETSGEHQLQCKLLCVGCGYVDHDASARAGRRVRRVLNIPLLHQGGAPYWSPHDEWVVREYLRLMLCDPHIVKRCHNGAFDTVVMWAHGLPVNGWAEDSMQLHHVYDAELPQNLGFVGSRFTGGRYWKDDVKGGAAWLDMDPTRLRSYNLRDVLVTIDSHDALLPIVKSEGLLPLYQQEVQLAQVMARATIRGVAIDYERRDSLIPDSKGKPYGLAPQLKLQMAAALDALRQVAGPTFDPGKPTELRWLLFDKLKLPVVSETSSGLPATNKEAFMLLDVAADSDEQRFALRNISQWRQAQKFLSTFVTGLEALADGRFHPSWKLLPVTGRFGSSPNFQNLPGRIKKIFRAARGYKLVGIDLSQAELRLLAYYTGEQTLREMYAKNINVHTVNASVLFKVKCPPEAKDHTNAQTDNYLRHVAFQYLGLPPGSYDGFPVMPKKNWKTTRTLAKNFEFGSAYGAEDETLYKVLRSKRDPETNELMFPTITLAETQALRVNWKRLRPSVIAFWENIGAATRKAGKYVCPISGRVRRYRGGFKRNETINTPIQMGVASWMNRGMLIIQSIFDRETGGAAQIVQQVHDALTVEAPDEYAQRAADVMLEVLCEPFSIRPRAEFAQAIQSVQRATLPADPANIADFLDET